MTPAHPRRPSALHATLLAQPGTDYQPDAWPAHDGTWQGSVRYDAGPLYVTVQGPSAALRELAAALVAAADQADQHTATPPAAPATDDPDPMPEGVAS
ncbi:MAG TPA: hypothetical protein VG276_15190 [Actinomycetes bacterium]|jgi:hypothetical protein|nr:hypothetical protein [Actinomycetes bacterium]